MLMKIISIVGTRPQFLKMIPLSIQFEKISNIESVIIHSGQHYDDNMSKDIFASLDIKMPEYILKRKGKTAIENLTNMMIELLEDYKKQLSVKMFGIWEMMKMVYLELIKQE